MKELAKRFKEPSSWAGISVLLSILAPQLGIAAEAVPHLVSIGAAIAGAAAVLIPEKKD